MISLRSLAEALKKYTFAKTGVFLFFVLSFFIFFGIFSFTKVSLEKFFSLDIFSFKHNSKISEKSPINYLSQTIEIDSPFEKKLSINEPIFPNRICSITDYGAIADGKTMNTEAFKKTIDSCVAAGGGKIIVPAGIWLTGPIHLKSNIELHIERDATILFSTHASDYLPVVFSRFEGIEYYNYSPPIYVADSTNVAITGAGTLDGQGSAAWWRLTKTATASINKLYAMGDDNVPLSERVFGTETAGLRPSFIQFVNCHNILIEDTRILNGPMWTIHPIYSDNIIIRDVDIRTNPGPSTDGIAIDSSSKVLVENSTFATGDDAIVLKSGRDKEGIRLHRPTEDVVIRNSTVNEAHGAVAIGSEVSGDVRNVFVNNINVKTAQYGFRIKATRGRGGIVENIWVENMQMRSASIEIIQITTSYGTPFRIDSTQPPLFRNINVKNISAEKAPHIISVNGLPELFISNVSLENISSFASRRGIEFSETDNVNLNNVQITTKGDDPLIIVIDSTRINIAGADCKENISVCLYLKGKNTKEITMQNSDSGKERVQLSPEVSADALIYRNDTVEK